MTQDSEEKWDYLDPKPGVQLRVKRRFLYHYGIYMGDGIVIEFGNGYEESLLSGTVTVQKTTLKDFLNGGRLEVRTYARAEKKRLKPLRQILETATAALGEQGYDIRNNNCKHFVDRCVFKR